MNEFGAILELRRQRQARGFGAYGSIFSRAVSSVTHAVTGAVSTVGRAAVGTAVATVTMPTTFLARGAAAIGVPGARQVASIGGAVTGIAVGQVPVVGRPASTLFMPHAPIMAAPAAPSWQPAPYVPAPAPAALPTGSRMDPYNTGAGYGLDGQYYPDGASLRAANDRYRPSDMPYMRPSAPAAAPAPAPMQVDQPPSQTAAQTAVETIEPTPAVAPTPAAADAVAPKSSGGAILAGAGAGFVVGGPIGAIAGGVIAHFMTKKA